jgi:hypothetical protein
MASSTDPAPGLVRSQRNCNNCDYSRTQGPGLYCWVEPPEPCNLGLEPPKLQGQMPKPIIVPVIRPTFPWYCCPRWAMRTADHPAYQRVEDVKPTHEGTEARQ